MTGAKKRCLRVRSAGTRHLRERSARKLPLASKERQNAPITLLSRQNASFLSRQNAYFSLVKHDHVFSDDSPHALFFSPGADEQISPVLQHFLGDRTRRVDVAHAQEQLADHGDLEDHGRSKPRHATFLDEPELGVERRVGERERVQRPAVDPAAEAS